MADSTTTPPTGNSIPDQTAPDGTVIPGVSSFDTYLSAAKAQLDTGFQGVVDSQTSAYTAQAAGYTDLASQVKAREPLVRQTYQNLSDELKQSQATETASAQATGEQNIGAATAAGAAAGLSDAQGSFRAPITAAQNDLTTKIATISNKYNLQQEDVTNQLNASVADLEDKAASYTQQGLTVQAQGAADMAKLAYDHEQQIQSLATQYNSTANQLHKDALNEYIQFVKIDQTNQRLDILAANSARAAQATENSNTIAQQRIAIEEYNATKPTAEQDKASAITSATNKINTWFKNSQNVLVQSAGSTENVLIPQIQRSYPLLTKSEISDLVYTQRKQYEQGQ